MITYRKDLDLISMVNDIAQRIQDEVDQQALDKAAATLAKFGYEKVVRCRDCDYYHTGIGPDGKRYAEPHCLAIGALEFGAVFEVDGNDFCSWGERRGDE